MDCSAGRLVWEVTRVEPCERVLVSSEDTGSLVEEDIDGVGTDDGVDDGADVDAEEVPATISDSPG